MPMTLLLRSKVRTEVSLRSSRRNSRTEPRTPLPPITAMARQSLAMAFIGQSWSGSARRLSRSACVKAALWAPCGA